MNHFQQQDCIWPVTAETKAYFIDRSIRIKDEEVQAKKGWRKLWDDLKSLLAVEGEDSHMSAVNQISIFDYSKDNRQFYLSAVTAPDRVDWTLALTLLTRHGGFSITGLAKVLGVSRDHLEGVAIGKINKPKAHAIDQLTGWMAQYVAPSQLKMVFV